jgi:hypothetical protein
MKRRVIALALCGLLGCDDDTDDTDDGNGASMSGEPTSPTDPTAAEGDSGSSDPTAGMSGCEGGPLPAPIAGCTPTPPPATGDFGQDCVDRINQFRLECQCLPPLQRWSDAEMCTDQQSSDDQSSGSAHGNFGVCNEFAQNTCPNWPSQEDVVVGCLQAMWDEGPGEPFIEHGHYINMSSTEYSKVACGSFASASGVWSNQNFSPLAAHSIGYPRHSQRRVSGSVCLNTRSSTCPASAAYR